MKRKDKSPVIPSISFIFCILKKKYSALKPSVIDTH
jgi:hypothetical protein